MGLVMILHELVQLLISMILVPILWSLGGVLSLCVHMYRSLTTRASPSPRSILITGASSGIGAAMAEAYAGKGIMLALTGRNAARLNAVAQKCRSKGAQVETTTIDVTQKEDLARWITSLDEKNAFDLVVANAGVSSNTLLHSARSEVDANNSNNKKDKDNNGSGSVFYPLEDRLHRIFDVNVNGVLHTICPLLTPLKTRGHGQIAIVSSLMSRLHTNTEYCASKACVSSLGLGLRADLRRFGIRVSVIEPGFVKSGMTDVNKFPMPFMISADEAASIIRRGLAQDRAVIAFPFLMYTLAWIAGSLPAHMRDIIYSLIMRGQAKKKKTNNSNTEATNKTIPTKESSSASSLAQKRTKRG
eukprot:TRINITY_DN10399_c0_g1_i2.p1 TRINITY_DN10399_c0_g1~~TRINITY_DN10399_c0_g1_i2.p1  ORF type:complete len:368 (-),score=86.78 TRINITY_DN10399_c0_g1_i2:4-1080(-)